MPWDEPKIFLAKLYNHTSAIFLWNIPSLSTIKKNAYSSDFTKLISCSSTLQQIEIILSKSALRSSSFLYLWISASFSISRMVLSQDDLSVLENKSVNLQRKSKGKTHQYFLHKSNDRPFPSSPLSLFQSESKCEFFVMVISSNFNMNENWFS